MKKYIVNFIIVCVLLVSCEQDKVIFNESQSFISFEESRLDLPIIIDGTGSIEANVSISSISQSERVFEVDIVQEETTANVDSYTVGSIVVPANSYTGTLTIEGVDNNVTTEPKALVVEIPNSADLVSTRSLIISVFQVCPVDETLFTGMYLIEQTSPYIFGSPTLADGTIVEISAEGLSRSFDTTNYSVFCATALNDFVFNLVCNETVVPLQNNTCNCNTGADYFGPATGANGTYDPDDDSTFTIVFSDDVQNECSGTTYQTTYTFTKQ